MGNTITENGIIHIDDLSSVRALLFKMKYKEFRNKVKSGYARNIKNLKKSEHSFGGMPIYKFMKILRKTPKILSNLSHNEFTLFSQDPHISVLCKLDKKFEKVFLEECQKRNV